MPPLADWRHPQTPAVSNRAAAVRSAAALQVDACSVVVYKKGSGVRSLERYVCVYGRFFQPPVENPWLEALEFEVSAYPYHGCNARITAGCPARSAASRRFAREARP